ncbi:DUF6314 family protein [Myceligenerans indicum]|uniref:DUF6314 domain-containing protein n=1 Tax=Myceligenerans indicum TaxID=2593663 RepID=A0ABS1LHT2_9MICO|nr:DUF6314 family protein [Myceligenerans indicum]MBL0885781.1 hypothetical protein [Myceligenerans indicum]
MDPARLLGTWDFRREVHDRLTGTDYAATGEATFTAEGAGRVRWAENGTLRWADRSTPVTRTLFLTPRRPGAAPPGSATAAPGWWVTFEDGRDFHPWTARPVEHVCGRDLYRGSVEPASPTGAPHAWTVRWHVTGPAKDYTMVSRYSAHDLTAP